MGGPANYIYTYFAMRNVLRLQALDWAWILFNGLLPSIVWMFSVSCFLFGAPNFLRRMLDDLARDRVLITGPTRALFPGAVQSTQSNIDKASEDPPKSPR